MGASFNLATAFVELKVKGQLGRLLEGQKQAWNDLRAAASKYKNIAAGAFAAGSAGITGLVAAASPLAFDTLTGSFKLLAATLGQAFVPIVIKASYYIQQVAKYIRDMDPDTKTSIGTWIGYGVALAGAVAITLKLATAFMSLAASPVLAGVALITVTIGTMAIKMKQLADHASEVARILSGGFSKQELESSPLFKRLQGIDSQEEREKVAQEAFDRANKHQQRLTEEFSEKGSLQQGFEEFTGGTDVIKKAKREAALKKAILDQIKAGKTPKEIAEGAASGGAGMALGKPGLQASYGGIEEAYKQAQLAALNTSELDRQILEAQIAGNELARKSAQHLEEIDRKAQFGMGR